MIIKSKTEVIEITVVVNVDENDYQYIESDWSNLLEAAKKNNLATVKSLMGEATTAQIEESLLMLEKAVALVKTHDGRQEVVGYSVYLDGYMYKNCAAVVSLATLQKIRETILSHLTDQHYQDNIELNAKDKRFITEKLLNKVKECTSLDAVIRLYKTYEHSPILTHQRHPNIAWLRSQLFHISTDSTLKHEFIAALQTKALELLKASTNIEASQLQLLEKTLFTKKGAAFDTYQAILTKFDANDAQLDNSL